MLAWHHLYFVPLLISHCTSAIFHKAWKSIGFCLRATHIFGAVLWALHLVSDFAPLLLWCSAHLPRTYCFRYLWRSQIPSSQTSAVEEWADSRSLRAPLPAAIRPCLCLLSICFLMAFMIREQSESSFQPHLCTISFPFVFSFPPIAQSQLPHSTGVIFELSCFLCPVSRGWKMLFLTVSCCIVV